MLHIFLDVLGLGCHVLFGILEECTEKRGGRERERVEKFIVIRKGREKIGRETSPFNIRADKDGDELKLLLFSLIMRKIQN